MDNIRRSINISEPIVWYGDLDDDCTAVWCGLMLRAECMEEGRWWWAVYDTKKANMEINSSNNTLSKFSSSEAARRRAESVALQYVETISRRVTSKFVINSACKIIGRGLVFLGRIAEGEISRGNIIEFVEGDLIRHRIITGGDGGVRSSNKDIQAGIFISYKDEAELEELIKWSPAGQVATIYE